MGRQGPERLGQGPAKLSCDGRDRRHCRHIVVQDARSDSLTPPLQETAAVVRYVCRWAGPAQWHPLLKGGRPARLSPRASACRLWAGASKVTGSQTPSQRPTPNRCELTHRSLERQPALPLLGCAASPVSRGLSECLTIRKTGGRAN